MKFVSPIKVWFIRKAYDDLPVRLCLSAYRNQHNHLEYQVKKIYLAEMYPQLKSVKLKTPISISYTLFKTTNHQINRANIISIVDKYFCNALQKYGCIPNNSDEYIHSTHYLSGKRDCHNPRVEIEIIEGVNV